MARSRLEILDQCADSGSPIDLAASARMTILSGGRHRDFPRTASLTLSFLTVWCCCRPVPAAEQSFVEYDLATLMQMELKVTSVSKRRTDLDAAAMAVSVVTAEDIRRLGITTLPEALRLVPGMDVARINANEWAIGSRGFNLQYSAKLLVLIDGRSIYTPTSAGVWWNDHNPLMADIERIEVIRGPGATLWGANAVNGVINIITRKAGDTQGLFTSLSHGTEARHDVEARYGAKLGDQMFYRASVRHFERENFTDSAGDAVADAWKMSAAGLRFDWQPSLTDSFTVEGDYHSGTVGQPWLRPFLSAPYAVAEEPRNENHGGNVLFRWTRERSADSSFTLQVYYDHFRHVDAGTAETRDTSDFDWQHRFALTPQQTLIWGAGYRHSVDDLPPIFFLTYVPARRTQRLYSAFVQDDIAYPQQHLTLTLGSKLEHHDFVGLQLQPNARLVWEPTEHQSLWGAVSRAVRTPSRYEVESVQNFWVQPAEPPELTTVYRYVVAGQLDAEEVLTYELGYRLKPAHNLSLDAATFYSVYDNLIVGTTEDTFFESEPAPPHYVAASRMRNNGGGHTYGVELSTRWSVTSNWTLIGGFTALRMMLQPDNAYLTAGDSPQRQFHLRSYLNLPYNFELNAATFYVDDLPNQHASSYVRADAGLLWHPSVALDIGIWGTNLLDKRHFEFTTYNTPLRTQVPRSVLLKASWQPER
jgi:iron complex outermembrane recepter protein